MPRIRFPRRSSLQYWPRKRARRHFANIRNWPTIKETKVAGFAGYKVGMLHATMIDNKPTSMTKGTEIVIPLTVIECPPITIIGIRTYVKDAYGRHPTHTIFAEKLDKEVGRTILTPKKQKTKIDNIKPEELSDVKVIIATQPKLTSIGKKKPDIFEMAIGGTSIPDKLSFAKNMLGKDFTVQDSFTEGMFIDTHAITKGRGVLGPVQRHGVNIRHHKSEKTKRGPGSLGPWHGTRNWPVAHQGQTGYWQRTEFNKWIVKLSKTPEGINPKSGWLRYGNVKNSYLLLKGSIGGPSKRLVTMTPPIRPLKHTNQPAPLNWLSTEV